MANSNFFMKNWLEKVVMWGRVVETGSEGGRGGSHRPGEGQARPIEDQRCPIRDKMTTRMAICVAIYMTMYGHSFPYMAL